MGSDGMVWIWHKKRGAQQPYLHVAALSEILPVIILTGSSMLAGHDPQRCNFPPLRSHLSYIEDSP
jgi:hypothetical protein